jgi:hypothetical protein
MSDRVLPAALVALLLLFLQVRSGAGLSAGGVAAIALLAYATLAGGRLLARAAGERNADASTAWVLGLAATCLALYGLTLLLPLTAGGAFAIVAAAVIAAELFFPARPVDWRGLIGFALCAAFTAAWCSEPAAAWQALRTQGVLPLWSDYFFHGGLISQFGDVRALGRGSIYLADHPPSFYHYASYGAAAALARMLDQPGLPLASAAWLPLGFLAMLAGAYALGARLAGAAGGIAALVAAAILPDASNYGLRNGWFSFHFTLLAHAGATYALGAAFMSLALLGGSRRALVASALLAASVLLFRAHVFVLFAPAWVAAAVVCHAAQSHRRRLGWLMAAGLIAGAAALSVAITFLAGSDAIHWRVRGVSALGDFLWHVHTLQEPTAYTGVYEALLAQQPEALAFAAGIGLAVLAALGAFVLLLPIAALLARRAGVLRPIDAACGYLVLCWLLLVLFAPTPWHGDATELTHRPFVLVYAACAIWTLCLFARLPAKPLWPALVAIAALALPGIAATADAMSRPKFRWGEPYDAAPIAPGLVEGAEFLRRHAAAGERFAVAGLSMRQETFDLSTELCALSGVPAYLSRPYYATNMDAARRSLALERLAALQEVDRQTDADAALRSLQSLKVRWYVVAGGQGPRWDPGRERAAFKSGTIALYRTAEGP